MMGVGSKTVLAAIALCALGTVHDKWQQCEEVKWGQSASFVCLLKNSGSILQNQMQSIRRFRN